MNRGDIYEVRDDQPEGSDRTGLPLVVVVSRNSINDSSTVVLVVPCVPHTNGHSVYPSHLLLEPAQGDLPQVSVVRAELVHPMDKLRLGERKGTLSREDIAQLDRALLNALDLSAE